MTSIVSKPWGSYEVLHTGDNYAIKKIIVKPGGILSCLLYTSPSPRD